LKRPIDEQIGARVIKLIRASYIPAYVLRAFEDFNLRSERNITRRPTERRLHFGLGLALSRLDEDGRQQAFFAYLPDMPFLKFLKLKIEVRLSDQLPSRSM